MARNLVLGNSFVSIDHIDADAGTSREGQCDKYFGLAAFIFAGGLENLLSISRVPSSTITLYKYCFTSLIGYLVAGSYYGKEVLQTSGYYWC